MDRTEKKRQSLNRRFGDIFYDVAKEELPKELFYRLLERAKARDAEYQAELAGMEDP